MVLKLAKIDENNFLLVFEGTNIEWAKKEGFTEMEVEQGYDEINHNVSWYLKGKAPAKLPVEILNGKEINKYQTILAQTDWYVTRNLETGAKIPEDIKSKRQEARDKISELKLLPV